MTETAAELVPRESSPELTQSEPVPTARRLPAYEEWRLLKETIERALYDFDKARWERNSIVMSEAAEMIEHCAAELQKVAAELGTGNLMDRNSTFTGP